jgi:3-(3-hydroxy-phenyl)propionate hydroxylase
LLLNFGTHGGIDVGAWVDRVCCVDARCNGVWELPAIGAVPAPTAVFVRPDGYVAWVGDGTQDGLADALARWCGAVVA